MNADHEGLAQDIALSDYWKAHPETPKNAQEKDLVTRTNMRRRVRQALRFGFAAGRKFERRPNAT